MTPPPRRPRPAKGVMASGMAAQVACLEGQNALIEANTAAVVELIGVLREVLAHSSENALAIKAIVARLGKMGITSDGKLRTTPL